MTAAERFAAWALELDLDDVPSAVVEAAKLHVLDVLGCGLAAHGLGIGTEGRTAMAELGGDPEASVIGLDAGLPAVNAAFANAMLCHGLDFDDTHSDSVSHVSTVVVPAALAVAEARGSTGRELLAAIVAGNEIVTRVGMATPGAFHERGFHPTAVCGIFGATAAAARLGGLTPARAASAFGIAGSMASGLFAYLDDGTATKPIHPGWAAHGALLAARLAELGAEGPPGVLEGRFGVFHAFVGTRIDLEPQLADLGERWETPRIAFKPYPACHFVHGSLGATASLRADLDPDQIEAVVVTVPEAGVSLVLEPAASKVCAAHGLRGQVQPPVLHGRHARPRARGPRHVHARGARRSPRARPGAKGPVRDEGVRELPGCLPRRRVDPAARREHARGRHAASARRAREPDERGAGAREVPRECRARRRRRASGGARPGARRGGGRARAADGPGRRGVTTVEQRDVVATVREWVEREVYPVASRYEHADEFPAPLVEEMKELGLFGVTIPEEYGGLGLDLLTYTLIQVELSRGWMSLSGVLNTHFISAWMIGTHGTEEQRSATCRGSRPVSCGSHTP